MKVKFKVKYDDAVKELSVASDTTVDEFIASAQLASVVPRVGIRNIVVRDQSSDLSASDCLANSCRSECLSVDWDECDEHVARLCEMGFSREHVVAALHEAGNHVESAIDKLLHVGATGNCLSFAVNAGVMGDMSDQSDVPSQLPNGSGDDMNLVVSVGSDGDLASARYYKLSADQGYAAGQNYYGFCLHMGIGVERDLVAAACYFKLSADQGDAAGQLIYGCFLENGLGVERDLVAGARYFKLAADRYCLSEHVLRGLTYYHGTVQCCSDCKAAASFKLAADHGDTTGQCLYGVCLYRGRGTDFDKDGAHAQFKAAAEEGDALGQFCYGLLLFEESGCDLEPNSPGWAYLHESAQQGCNEAAVIIGLQEFADNNNFETRYFQRALEEQDLCALYNYGISLLVDESTYAESAVFQQMVYCFKTVMVLNTTTGSFSRSAWDMIPVIAGKLFSWNANVAIQNLSLFTAVICIRKVTLERPLNTSHEQQQRITPKQCLPVPFVSSIIMTRLILGQKSNSILNGRRRLGYSRPNTTMETFWFQKAVKGKT